MASNSEVRGWYEVRVGMDAMNALMSGGLTHSCRITLLCCCSNKLDNYFLCHKVCFKSHKQVTKYSKKALTYWAIFRIRTANLRPLLRESQICYSHQNTAPKCYTRI